MPLRQFYRSNLKSSARRRFQYAIGAGVSGLVAAANIHAAPTLWSATAANFSWETPGNWSLGVPISTTDASFDQTSYAQQAAVSSADAMQGLIFGDGTTAAAAATISANGAGGSLTIGSDGIVDNANAGAATVSAPITFSGAANINVSSINNLVLSGALTGTGTLNKTGVYQVTLSGNDTGFTGGINIGNGIVALPSTSGAGFATISAVNFAAGGQLTAVMPSASRTITTLNMSAGIDVVQMGSYAGGSTGGVLSIGTINRSPGTLLNFGSSDLTTNNLQVTGTTMPSMETILGGWAIVNNKGWAVINPSTHLVSEFVPTLATGSAAAPSVSAPFGSDVAATASSNTFPSGVTTINSLWLDSSGATTVTIPASTFNISTGGILDYAGAAAVTFSGSAGSALTSGSSDLVLHAAAPVTFQVPVVNNGSTPVGIVKSNSGVLTLTGTNGADTNSGPTNILVGTIVAAATNVLSPNSVVNLLNTQGAGGATLNVSGYANKIEGFSSQSLTTLDLGIGNVLTDTGTAAFAGSLVISGTASTTPTELMSYTSETGTFSKVTGIPAGYYLSYGANQLDLVGISNSNLTWNNAGGGGDGLNWDTTSLNWNNGGGVTTFNNSGGLVNVTFNDTNNGHYNVQINTAVTPNSTTFNNTGTYNISGSSGIGGTGPLSILGSGKVNLATSDTFTGQTTLSAGTLNLQNAFALQNSTVNISSGSLTFDSVVSSNAFIIGGLMGNGNLSLANTAGAPITLTLGGNNANTSFGGMIAGAGNIVATGSGHLTLLGNNTYSGGTMFSASSDVETNNNSAFGTGVLNFNGGGIGTLNGATGVVIANPFQFPASGSFENYQSFTMSGSGFLGSGATYNPSSGFSGGSSGMSVIYVSAPSVNFSGQISGGGLTLGSGSTTLELSGPANTFAGPVVVQGGTLQLDTAGSIAGVQNSTGGITVASGADLLINDTADTNAGLTGGVAGGVPLVAIISGTGVAGNGALRGADNQSVTWAGGINASNAAQISPGFQGTLTLTGPIAGNGPVIFQPNSNSSSSTSTLVLSPGPGISNTYTGESQVVAGKSLATFTLSLGANNGFSTASGLNFNGGSGVVTVDLDGNNQSVTYLSNAVALGAAGQLTNSSVSAPSVLTITNGNNSRGSAVFNVPINGNLSVAKYGSGNQFLNGNSFYSGGTTISAGTVTAGSANALGSGPVTLNGGTLSLSHGTGASTYVPLISGLSSSTFTSNGSFGVNGAALTLTTGPSQQTTAWTNNPVSFANGFVAKFSYTVTSPYAMGQALQYAADGMTFCLQNSTAALFGSGPSALGSGGGQLGYGEINNSAALATNIFAYTGAGTAFTSGGVLPGSYTTNDFDLSTLESATTPVTFNYTVTYSPAAQVLTLSLASPSGTFNTNYSTGNLADLVGGSSAYIGFTGSTGGNYAAATISNFSYSVAASGPTSISNSVIAAPSTSSMINLSVLSSQQAGAIGSLNIASGALVSLTSTSQDGIATRGVLTVAGVTLSGSSVAWSGQLDLGNNSLDVQVGSVATLTDQLRQGYAGGTWRGTGGITSTAAAADTAHLTALGILLNDNGSGVPYYGPGGSIATSFGGATPADGDVLIKYTYYGDTDLNGQVDGSDYSVVDFAYLFNQNPANAGDPMTGWQNGDFNYDGAIDGSDFTLMDNAFNQQGVSLAGEIANPLARVSSEIDGSGPASVVPEPAMLGLLGMGTAGLLGRRRRYR